MNGSTTILDLVMEMRERRVPKTRAEYDEICNKLQAFASALVETNERLSAENDADKLLESRHDERMYEKYGRLADENARLESELEASRSENARLKAALEKSAVRQKVQLRQRTEPMRKSKCLFCCEGSVFDKDFNVVGHIFCDIESYDPEIGCNPNCNDYIKTKEEEQ